MNAAISSDPVRIIEALNVEQIRKELDDLEQRQDALRILYRAAAARQRKRDRQQNQTAKAAT